MPIHKHTHVFPSGEFSLPSVPHAVGNSNPFSMKRAWHRSADLTPYSACEAGQCDAQGLGATLLVLGSHYPSVQRSHSAAWCQAGMEDRQFQLSQQAASNARKGIPSTRGSCLTGFASVVSDGFHLVRRAGYNGQV